MVIIKERKLLRCCFNCKNINIEFDDGVVEIPIACNCSTTRYGDTVVEPTGICEFFMRKE
jgi:hypothetical protein